MTLELVYNRVVVHGFYNFIAVGWIASYPILINKNILLQFSIIILNCCQTLICFTYSNTQCVSFEYISFKI